MYCSFCAKQIPERSKYCPYCGYKVVRSGWQRPAIEYYDVSLLDDDYHNNRQNIERLAKEIAAAPRQDATSADLNALCDTCLKICDKIEASPYSGHRTLIRKFTTVYLPELIGVLYRYSVTSGPDSGVNSEVRDTIEEAAADLNESFAIMVEELEEAEIEENDINVEVLKRMLRRDGYYAKDETGDSDEV